MGERAAAQCLPEKELCMLHEKQPRQDVTVVITSCGRHDLLANTLASFREFNTYDGIKEVIVVEDGEGEPYSICQRYGATLLSMKRRVGQIGAIDHAYGRVVTPYVFHLEDDWEFYKPGFIERSRALLSVDPSTLCVWLRSWDDTNGHPISFRSDDETFGVMSTKHAGIWHGFTFNPGLRRLKDYKRLGTYGSVGTGAEPEADISQRYFELGFRAVILDREGYVRHTGWNRSTLGHDWTRSSPKEGVRRSEATSQAVQKVLARVSWMEWHEKVALHNELCAYLGNDYVLEYVSRLDTGRHLAE